MRGVAAILGVLITACVAAAQTPGFWLVGQAPGASGSWVTALSANGGLAAGASDTGVGFSWTRENGRYDFGLEPGMPGATWALGASSGGNVLVGTMHTDSSTSSYMLRRPYRRVGSGPLLDLGLLPGNSRGYANGVSGDGGTVVGACEWGSLSAVNGQAFRWTQQGGMQGLGYVGPGGGFSQALDISRDGTTIVGQSNADAFVWRQGTGTVGLPRLPGVSPTSFTRADAVNADGSVIVGIGTSPQTGTSTALRWTAGGVQDLGTLPGYLRSVATAVDGSGNVICGDIYTSLTGLPDTAFVWTPQTGMKLLSDFLLSYGVSVPAGYRISHVSAISEDGLTFAGHVVSLGTPPHSQGFVVTVPAPAAGFALVLLPALRRRRRPSAA